VSIKSAKPNDVWVNVVDQAHFKERGRNIWKKRKKNILQIFVSFIIIMIVSITFTTIIGFLKTACLLNGFHLSCMSNIFVIKHWWRNRQTKQNLHRLKNCLRKNFWTKLNSDSIKSGIFLNGNFLTVLLHFLKKTVKFNFKKYLSIYFYFTIKTKFIELKTRLDNVIF
jgi:YesN/AraC family two-component response regulator